MSHSIKNILIIALSAILLIALFFTCGKDKVVTDPVIKDPAVVVEKFILDTVAMERKIDSMAAIATAAKKETTRAKNDLDRVRKERADYIDSLKDQPTHYDLTPESCDLRVAALEEKCKESDRVADSVIANQGRELIIKQTEVAQRDSFLAQTRQSFWDMKALADTNFIAAKAWKKTAGKEKLKKNLWKGSAIAAVLVIIEQSL